MGGQGLLYDRAEGIQHVRREGLHPLPPLRLHGLVEGFDEFARLGFGLEPGRLGRRLRHERGRRLRR